MTPGWCDARERVQSALFAPLRRAFAALPHDRWPTHDELTALAAGATTARGQPVRFVPPAPADDPPPRYYETHIADTGEVPTRAGNWHDLLNALAWITWPLAKARINAQHAAILAERGDEELRQRGPERDALTLFDEAGVVVAASDPELLHLIREFAWKRLFWHERERAVAGMSCFLFGHGTLEQALAPYVGMVSKAVFIPVERSFHSLPVATQVRNLDALLAAHFADRARFASTKTMAAVPILGIPGWHAPQDEAFYDNAAYFRSKPAPKKVRAVSSPHEKPLE